MNRHCRADNCTIIVLAVLVLGLSSSSLFAAGKQKTLPKVTINEAEFRDKVFACWMGKNIGGTLGAPLEGKRDMHNLTFYDPVPEKASANDDLDLQLLWLKALEENGPNINARILGGYWLKFVPVDWNEYGIGKANMRAGFQPPLSGQFRNKWRDSNGAWIRTEIWACLAPGCPAIAARYAWEDACVDHGAAEGTNAAMFVAALESAAFVESDRDKLIEIGLSYIPPDCAVAKSINAAIEAHKKGLDLTAARHEVLNASKSTGWFMAPQNVAFVILGWLYGEGDFGKSLCCAVNCGDDTDCTGATLGSILGIIHGAKGIPENWTKPVGSSISTVAVAGFKHPRTIDELTDRTVAMTHIVLKELDAPVAIAADAATDPKAAVKLKLIDPAAAKTLWARSGYQLIYDFVAVRATLDFLADPVVEKGKPCQMKLWLENQTPHTLEIAAAWWPPLGLTAAPAASTVKLPARSHKPVAVETTFTAERIPDTNLPGAVQLRIKGQSPVSIISFTLKGKPPTE